MKNKLHITNGQTLAEFALILPMLMLLVMGTIDLGRAVYYKSTIANASREAARYGAVNHCDEAGISKTAQEFAIGLQDEVQVDEISIKYLTKDDVTTPEYISISISFDFLPVTPMVGNFLGDDGVISLNDKATQRIEQPLDCK